MKDPWAALGDRTRRTIFGQLAVEPRAVGELAETLPVSRPAVSQHLKVLKSAGLVVDDRVGARRIYRVNESGLRRLRAELDTYWNDTLVAYKRVVESTETAQSTAQNTAQNTESSPPPEGNP